MERNSNVILFQNGILLLLFDNIHTYIKTIGQSGLFLRAANNNWLYSKILPSSYYEGWRLFLLII